MKKECEIMWDACIDSEVGKVGRKIKNVRAHSIYNLKLIPV